MIRFGRNRIVRLKKWGCYEQHPESKLLSEVKGLLTKAKVQAAKGFVVNSVLFLCLTSVALLTVLHKRQRSICRGGLCHRGGNPAYEGLVVPTHLRPLIGAVATPIIPDS